MKDQIKNYIITTYMSGNGSLEDDEQLFEKGIIDSTGFIKLLSFIEKEFNVKMDMIDITMDKFATVNQIENSIKEKM